MKRMIASIFFITLFAGFAAATPPNHVVAGPIAVNAYPSASAQAPAHTKAVAHMTVTGRVTALTATDLKIERTVKGKAEVMEFTLEKPLTGFVVGEEVVIKYHVKEGKTIAMEVLKPPAKK